MTVPFNSPLETGIRSLTILTSIFPQPVDLQHLVYFDYLTIHSGDVNGPPSLHSPLPMRSGELTIRRKLIERGLFLMMSRGLVEYLALPDGFKFAASETSYSFLSMLSSDYILKLQSRASWVVENFGQASLNQLQEIERSFFKEWTTQFQVFEITGENKI